jgi:hypothetical protein
MNYTSLFLYSKGRAEEALYLHQLQWLHCNQDKRPYSVYGQMWFMLPPSNWIATQPHGIQEMGFPQTPNILSKLKI